MNPEEMEELKTLIEFLKENQIGEFDLERGDFKVRLKFASAMAAANSLDMAQMSHLLAASQAHPAAIPVPVSAAAATSAASAAVSEDAGLHMVKSPIVGTFYESSSPGSEAFVKVGDHVQSGQILCIVEAMKLMNEIESDVTGEIVKRFVSNGQPVEYGQQLFSVRPS